MTIVAEKRVHIIGVDGAPDRESGHQMLSTPLPPPTLSWDSMSIKRPGPLPTVAAAPCGSS